MNSANEKYWRNKRITIAYLEKHPDHIFVFGDNTMRRGRGGGASLRHMPNSYGFITKKEPKITANAYYRPEEYREVYEEEIGKLREGIEHSPEYVWLVSKVGAGLANRFGIWEEVIEPRIRKDLMGYENVRFLWE